MPPTRNTHGTVFWRGDATHHFGEARLRELFTKALAWKFSDQFSSPGAPDKRAV